MRWLTDAENCTVKWIDERRQLSLKANDGCKPDANAPQPAQVWGTVSAKKRSLLKNS